MSGHHNTSIAVYAAVYHSRCFIFVTVKKEKKKNPVPQKGLPGKPERQQLFPACCCGWSPMGFSSSLAQVKDRIVGNSVFIAYFSDWSRFPAHFSWTASATDAVKKCQNDILVQSAKHPDVGWQGCPNIPSMPLGFRFCVFSEETVRDSMSWTGMDWMCCVNSRDLWRGRASAHACHRL